MTGRAAGGCAGSAEGEQEIAILKPQAQQIGTELEQIQDRIQELEAKPSDS